MQISSNPSKWDKTKSTESTIRIIPWVYGMLNTVSEFGTWTSNDVSLPKYLQKAFTIGLGGFRFVAQS